MTEKPKKSALNQNEPRLDLNYQFEELDNKQNKTVRITTQSANRMNDRYLPSICR